MLRETSGLCSRRWVRESSNAVSSSEAMALKASDAVLRPLGLGDGASLASRRGKVADRPRQGAN